MPTDFSGRIISERFSQYSHSLGGDTGCPRREQPRKIKLHYVSNLASFSDSVEYRLHKILRSASAYDDHIEYAFTSHLRNCSQHCKNVVHGFNCTTGIGISSNTSRLLSEYKKWKQIDKDYMAACGSDVDLLKTFSETFSAFNTALKPVMQYLLNNNNTGTKLLYLREWGDSLHSQFKHDVHCYHIVNIEFSDGSSATQNDMASGDVIVNAYPLDWELIYELSDSITPLKQK